MLVHVCDSFYVLDIRVANFSDVIFFITTYLQAVYKASNPGLWFSI